MILPRSGRRAVAVALVLVLVGAAAWLGVPRWLSVEDALEPCPVVVVLNGDPPARADEGARLYHARVSSEVWLTDDPNSSDLAGDAGSRWNTAHLGEQGVPAQAIRRVPGSARGTRAEMEAVGAELRRRQIACAIAITSPLHARRVRLTWDRHVGAPRLIVRHASGANYVGWDKAAREFVGALLVIAGLD
jgi:uncharacterized SAM-binding protein YcdF (DUF218 family)